MKNKKENFFSAQATLQMVRNYILDILGIFGIVYSVLNFNENPTLFSIVLIFLTAMILLTGYNRVQVFESEIVFKFQHSIDFLSKKWYFRFDEIESISADLRLSKKMFVISEIVSVIFPVSSLWNKITITKKDGSVIIINTKVYKHDLEKTFENVRIMSKNTVRVIFS
jgi:hypothetical protein